MPPKGNGNYGMNKLCAAAAAFSVGALLAGAAGAAGDPNCPDCVFVKGAVNRYEVGKYCTWVKIDSLDSSIPDNKRWFTVATTVPSYLVMSAMLHAAYLTSKFDTGTGHWSGEVVTIEHNNAADTDCASNGGNVIQGAASQHDDE